jgi:glycyl-tRNA synthetase alpha subunit
MHNAAQSHWRNNNCVISQEMDIRRQTAKLSGTMGPRVHLKNVQQGNSICRLD